MLNINKIIFFLNIEELKKFQFVVMHKNYTLRLYNNTA